MALLAFIVFAAGFAAYLGGRLTAIATRRPEKKTVHGLIGGVVVGIVALVILTLSAHHMIHNSTQIEFGVSAEKANDHLHSLDIPAQATDVNYRNNPSVGILYVAEVADFTIDEKSFLTWAKSNGWKMTRFITKDREKELDIDSRDDSIPSEITSHSHTAYPVKSFVEEHYDELVSIHNGYYASTYTEENPDCGEKIEYDLDNGRAYIISTIR